MKVSELIEALQKMPQDLEVFYDSGCRYCYPEPQVVKINDACKRAYKMYNDEYVVL